MRARSAAAQRQATQPRARREATSGKGAEATDRAGATSREPGGSDDRQPAGQGRSATGGSHEQKRHNAAQKHHQPPARCAGERSERQRSERGARRTSGASRPGAVSPLRAPPADERPKGAGTDFKKKGGFAGGVRGGGRGETAEGCAAERASIGGHCVGSFLRMKKRWRRHASVVGGNDFLGGFVCHCVRSSMREQT